MGEYSVRDRPYGPDDTEVENGIFLPIAQPEELQNYIYCMTSASLLARAITGVSIGTGNNERAIRENIAL